MNPARSHLTLDARSLSMTEFKRVVSEVGAQPDTALHLEHFGWANQITGYRLYYMLQYARRAGVGHLTLLTDGAFWIEEAGDWLIDAGVDDVIVTSRRPLEPALATRIERFALRTDAPSVIVMPSLPRHFSGAR